MTRYVAAIDQGTTSTRCILFDHAGRIVAQDQVEHRQILPRPGWVEHDPLEIWENSRRVVAGALARGDLTGEDVVAVGITNQRETTVVWDRRTGEPVYNAIVWQDTRTQGICDRLAGLGGGADRYRARTGLPLATYFAGPKARWILDEVDGARDAAERGELMLGTIDSWLLWNATGGPEGGLHVTDVTNASRTLLMDLDRLAWDEDIAAEVGIPTSMLPEIRSSSEVYGTARAHGMLSGVPVAGALGDQQAATFGQVCFDVGTGKNTYGTGNFLLLNTGRPAGAERARPARDGLLPDRGRRPRLRARGVHRRHRLARPVAARQPRAGPLGGRGRDPGPGGGGQRRRVLRAGVLGSLRAVLALRRPRCARRAHPLRQPRPRGACRPRGHGVPDAATSSTRCGPTPASS